MLLKSGLISISIFCILRIDRLGFLIWWTKSRFSDDVKTIFVLHKLQLVFTRFQEIHYTCVFVWSLKNYVILVMFFNSFNSVYIIQYQYIGQVSIGNNLRTVTLFLFVCSINCHAFFSKLNNLNFKSINYCHHCGTV